MSLTLAPTELSRFQLNLTSALDQLQQNQFLHDETYHREIARLTVQRRLTHMTLHFAKYAGYLGEISVMENEQKVLTDILIIGLSSANILNMRLSECIDFSPKNRAMTVAEYRNSLIIATGKMAAACEKLDHLEDFPFRVVLCDNVRQIVQVTLNVFFERNIDVEVVIQERLSGIRSKALFE